MRNGQKVKRRGNVIVLIALLMPVLAGMGAFAIDVGYMAFMLSQAQAGADAGALAAVDGFPGDKPGVSTGLPSDQATLDALTLRYAMLNSSSVNNLQVTAEPGIWDETSGTLIPATLADAEAVRVTVLRPDASLFFGQLLGAAHANISASAIAMFNDGIAGFEVIDGGAPCSLMPFALRLDSWIDALTGNGADAWSYNSDTCVVSPGGDGTVEINLYPEKGNTPGNFGTVDIGNTNNSTVDLSRQILNGPTAADLAPYGGTLELDPTTANFEVNGECGVSAALKDDLEAIIGIPRTIMLFDQVTAVGENTYYRIVGFAGLTIVNVDLTTGNKHVTVQPTWVTDPTVILGDSGQGDYVRHPPQLVQ